MYDNKIAKKIAKQYQQTSLTDFASVGPNIREAVLGIYQEVGCEKVPDMLDQLDQLALGY